MILALPILLAILCSCEPERVLPKPLIVDGVYTVKEANQAQNYLLTLKKKENQTNRVTVENLANLIKNPLEATVSGNKLIIYEQPFVNYLGDQYTITGEGEVYENTLRLRYTIKGYNGYNGSVLAQKQADE
ncbi:hypothetical protein GCM10027347_21720 [Larkinella harenae]